MGRLTPQKKKHFSVKMNQKSMKCTVRVRIQAITCPGVVLPCGKDVYLSVCVMGQYRKTGCLPPVFPLLFHHNMEFVKSYSGALHPNDIADLLEEGEVLATVEANTREFLYPGPRQTWRAGAPEREILMKRSITFPGISPKVEFTTTSVIQECDGRDIKLASPPCCPDPATPNPPPSPGQRGSPRAVADGSCSPSGYQQPTVASRSRALSPYTHRRMCQLSWDAVQRLAHLRLGPHRFRKETDTHTPFLVPRSLSSSMVESPSPRLSAPRHTRSLHSSLSPCHTTQHTDSSLLGSYRPKSGRKSSKQEVPKTPLRGFLPPPAQSTPGSAPGRPQSTPGSAPRRPQSTPGSAPGRPQSTPGSAPRRPQSTPGSAPGRPQSTPGSAPGRPQSTPGSAPRRPQALSGSSLRERFQNSPSSPWEEIHRRVQNILRTHQSHRKLSFDDDEEDAHSSTAPPGEMSGPLDDGPSWRSQGTHGRGTPPRAVFEQSLGNIYHDMYQQASSST
ncbi:spermatogenesis-associated protein 6 isoform X2 [Hypomesus transpacificus]|uniref:spermatogenesis-associated protein 6 isoform X2 n=1 Tax=Hypomesus transpacificus TaxID=137520 RepID=UPI001F086AE8|nr:spermatogenesis-associated protein 6 isoform X2 [Hypomesus transpacificus]